MDRRTFLHTAAAVPVVLAADVQHQIPKYRVVTRFKPAEKPGMPGPYAGHVVAVHSEKSIDAGSDKVDLSSVREMMSRGMRSLTGDKDPRDSWARFFSASDVVGIKVNCSGAPGIMSTPEVVGEIVRNLGTVGVKPENVYIYERFQNQIDTVRYDRYVPRGVHIWTAETGRWGGGNYDPATYVEVNFFGEEDTRSNLSRIVSERLTKIINVPNLKEHGASGVTGCLKNIAYGSFSNVARSHSGVKTNTYSFIGTLAAVEPLRSRTVLQVMDGLKGVWHGGPFSTNRRFRFYPKQIMFGTDPVAIDRMELDIITAKRNAEHAAPFEDVSPAHLKPGGAANDDPQIHRYIREPGHIEYAATTLGLGVYDIKKIKVTRIEI